MYTKIKKIFIFTIFIFLIVIFNTDSLISAKVNNDIEKVNSEYYYIQEHGVANIKDNKMTVDFETNNKEIKKIKLKDIKLFKVDQENSQRLYIVDFNETAENRIEMVSFTINLKEDELPRGAGTNLIGKNVIQILYYSEDYKVLYHIFSIINKESMELLIQNSDELNNTEDINNKLSNGINTMYNFLFDYKPNFVYYEKSNIIGNSMKIQSITPIEIKPYMYDNYTNVDTFVDSYIHKNRTELDLEYFKGDIDIYTDDDIVKIIPKDLFKTLGVYLYIGREYGFYINTEIDSYHNLVDENGILYGEVYISEVFVFNIEHNIPNGDYDHIFGPENDPDKNNDDGSINVSPLFKYRFNTYFRNSYGMPDGDVWDAKFDSNLYEVVLPHKLPDPFTGDSIPEMQLYNIGFDISLINTDKLNYNQPIIDPETNQPIIDPVTGEVETNYPEPYKNETNGNYYIDDHGDNFTGAQYRFDGRGKKNYPNYDSNLSVTDVISAVGTIAGNFFPPIETATQWGIDLYELYKDTNNFIEFIEEEASFDKRTNDEPFVFSFSSDRTNQLEEYIDENNKLVYGKLVRNISFDGHKDEINKTDNDGNYVNDEFPLFDLPQHFAEFSYKVKHDTDSSVTYTYNNAIISSIKLKVVREYEFGYVGKLASANHGEDPDNPDVPTFNTGNYISTPYNWKPPEIYLDSATTLPSDSLDPLNLMGDDVTFLSPYGNAVYYKYRPSKEGVHSFKIYNSEDELKITLYEYINGVKSEEVSSVSGLNPELIYYLKGDKDINNNGIIDTNEDIDYYIKISSDYIKDTSKFKNFSLSITRPPLLSLQTKLYNSITLNIVNNDYSTDYSEIFVKIENGSWISLGNVEKGESVNYKFYGLNSSSSYDFSTYTVNSNNIPTSITTKNFSTYNQNTFAPSISSIYTNHDRITVRLVNNDPNTAELFIKKGIDNWISLGLCDSGSYIDYTFSNLDSDTPYWFHYYAENDHDEASVINNKSYSTTVKTIATPSLYKTSNLPDRITVKVTNKDTVPVELFVKIGSGSWKSLGWKQPGQYGTYTFTGLISGESYSFSAYATNYDDVTSNTITRGYSTASGGITPDSIECKE